MADAEPSKSAAKKAEKQAKMAAAKAEKAAKQAAVAVVGGKKAGDDSKEIIGITHQKDVSFSLWYQDLVIKAELIEYYNEVREGQVAAARMGIHPHGLGLTFGGR